jgi:hypothetical protein
MEGLLPLGPVGCAVVIVVQGLVALGLVVLLWWSQRQGRARAARRDRLHQSDLAAVADQADRIAAAGVSEPGSRGLLLMFPAFDFTESGRNTDPRGTQETRLADPEQKWVKRV